MNSREEFLEILRVLIETPPSAGKEPPAAERPETGDGGTGRVESDRQCADENWLGAA
jgi:hypothetical protein